MSGMAEVLGSKIFAGRQLNEPQIEAIVAALAAAGFGPVKEATAKALEDAAQDFEDNIGVGEFDELARRDGRRWTHIDDAWEYQGPYMDWLRARAAAARGDS
ncbi:hypothetical protein ABC337_15285 [Arthrobacter sp. 1P04PC]|uniref:hypothetical protein n=1 Tax=unclassified Arthrobacter TaxID=235627 RepID=UPI00399F094C